MVDVVYRGNIELILSIINHLKKYIISFIIVLLILLSIFHFSKYSVHFVPLFTITFVLLPVVYYTTVLVLKFVTTIISSNQTREIAVMNANSDQGHGLKTPDRPYPNSPTPPPTYEEATRNDHYYQPQPWLPSTSSGYTSSTSAVFNLQYQYTNRDVMKNYARISDMAAATMTTNQNNLSSVADGGVCDLRPSVLKPIQNIPSVTITSDDDQRPMEI
ncbi:uncharacterized protein LOC112681486 isoform X2 [Sipha flava]|nr:uncharacterized protein LOC112681486 isoform X2 [Sipha flava]